VTADARGWRIALLPDALVDSHDVLSVLEDSGYGLLQLPPPGDYSLLLAVIADQVAEYAHHGYAVVAIGLRGAPGDGDGLHWRRLAPLLRRRSVALPRRHILTVDSDPTSSRQKLATFLAGHDLTPEEQRRWRV
jgi:hypothetical protein